MKKIIAAIAASLLSLSAAIAQTMPAPTVAARSFLLLDATSGQVLASQEPDMRIEPASLTKIMTAYLVFQAIQEKKLALDQMVNVSVRAWKVSGDSSKMFIEPSTPVSINDLLYGLIVQSGNDAAVALAEAVSGTEEAFAVLMNREAERMGLKSTRFANAAGMPQPGQLLDRERPVHPGLAPDPRLPGDVQDLLDQELHLQQDHPAQPQPPAVAGPDRGRHEDRPHPGCRLLPDRVGAPPERHQRRTPAGLGGARRHVPTRCARRKARSC